MHEGLSRGPVFALLAAFDYSPRRVGIALRHPRTQPTGIRRVIEFALATVQARLRRSGLRIGGWQTVDRNAHPERGSQKPHGLNPSRPRVSPTSESGAEFREPQREQQSKRCEDAARLNLLLTLRRPPALASSYERCSDATFSATEGANFQQRCGGDSASPRLWGAIAESISPTQATL